MVSCDASLKDVLHLKFYQIWAGPWLVRVKSAGFCFSTNKPMNIFMWPVLVCIVLRVDCLLW